MFSLGNGTLADGAQLSCLCSSVIVGEMFKAGGTFHSEGLPSMFVFGRLSVSLNKKLLNRTHFFEAAVRKFPTTMMLK